MKRLYIIIPCYNEEQVLPVTAPMFLEKIEQLAAAARSVRTAGSFSSMTVPVIRRGRSSATLPVRIPIISVSARAATVGIRMPFSLV